MCCVTYKLPDLAIWSHGAHFLVDSKFREIGIFDMRLSSGMLTVLDELCTFNRFTKGCVLSQILSVNFDKSTSTPNFCYKLFITFSASKLKYVEIF